MVCPHSSASKAVVCLNTLWIAIDTDNNKASIITNASIEFQAADGAGSGRAT